VKKETPGAAGTRARCRRNGTVRPDVRRAPQIICAVLTSVVPGFLLLLAVGWQREFVFAAKRQSLSEL
jgi:hypothetical protein